MAMAADPRDGESDEARPAGDGDLQLRPDATAGDPTAPPVELPPPRTFWTELRSRKVVQVTVSYAVLAWLLVQIASVVLPAFDAPGWAMRLTIFLLALGLPVALVLSWAFDIGAHGIRRVPGRGGNLRIGVAAASLAAVAVGWFVFGQQALDQAITAEERSVAVLPFVNVGGERANEYLSDGLAETTLDMLAQVGDLKVIARTSSFAFKGRDVDAREIGRSLGAAHLLEGSVQRAGDMLRITAQLVRASDGSRLWSRRFDRPMADVFAVQDEIAGSVVGALKLALLPGQLPSSSAHHVPGAAAYEQFLLGRQGLHQGTPEGFAQAVAGYGRAIALEPDYAAAHAGLAVAEASAADLANDSAAMEAGLSRALAAADTAVRLDDALADAHAVRGYLRGGVIAWEWDVAQAAFARALALNPGDAVNLMWSAELLATLGRLGDAIERLQQAIALDPLSAWAWTDLGRFRMGRGDLPRAREALERARAVSPGFGYVARELAQLSLLEGDATAALPLYAQASHPLFRLAGEAMALHALGDAGGSSRALAELEAGYAASSAYQLAQARAWRHEHDAAFDWLHRAIAQRDAGLQYVKFDPLLRGLRGDARFGEVLARMGLGR